MIRPILPLAGTIVLLLGLTGLAAAAPGDGPPGDASGPVPEFVLQGFDEVDEIAGGIAGEVLEFVHDLAPEAAADGLDTAAGAVPR